MPSLVDQFEIVKQYWSIIDGGRQEYEVPLHKVTKLLVDKHIATDVEMAKKIIRGVQVNKSSSSCTYDEFKRIFCKAIFKNCLLSIISEILSYNPFGEPGVDNKTDDENAMSVHIRSTSYQRQLLKKGIISETEDDLKRGRSVLNSLADFKNNHSVYTDEELFEIFNKRKYVETPSSLQNDDFNFYDIAKSRKK